MSNYSPYIYNLGDLPLVTIKKIEEYFEHFTFLDKPNERNVYKISLAQLIHYLIDFGVGYNSVCTTAVTSRQEFATTMYVNRHESSSPLRPATAADLKEKLLKVVETLIHETVQQDKYGVYATDSIYPKYIFTLDEELDSIKLKQLTGKDYIEEKDFVDFPFTATTAPSTTITYEDGYVFADFLLLCPEHKHGGDDKFTNQMSKSIKYSWHAYLKPDKGVAWWGHINNIHTKSDDGTSDPIGTLYNQVSSRWKPTTCNSPSISPSWQFPNSVSCYPNEKVYPGNTEDVKGGKYVNIRYPGRRYRLFKRAEP